MDALWSSYWFRLLVIILILLLAALFTLLEYSVVKVRPSELQELRQTRKVKRAEHMVNNLNEYLSTAQVGVTMTSLVLGWIGDQFITDLLLKIHLIPREVLVPLAPVIGVLIFTFFHAVFTDLVPKNMAIDRPVQILLAIVHPIQFFHTIFYPFVWLFAVTAAWITKLLGYNVQPEEDTYSQNEIMTLSQQSEKAGEMDKEDVLFMRRAFEMNDKVAEDIMIDRTQLAVIDIQASIEDAAKLYFEKKFTRFPVVANNDKDHILGYVFAYDIMRQNQINPQQSIRTIMRRIPIVYENEPITNVLQTMVKKQVPIVVVQDMIEKKNPDSKGNPTYEVSGKMPLDDFERFFNTKIDQFENSEVTTLTGFFLERQYDMKVGQPIRVENFSFTPLDLQNAYVNKFKVVYIKPKKKAAQTDDGETDNK